ncbi:hypothetical protein K0G46_06830 [Phocaeicola vulgatus]|jgi:hypothetical protein|uniref:hypothetical protein n=1 Tax=Phocaeicola vulgatus TaxID=821 RepID=UPI001F2B5E77|nr:hypothetical protein [Phocaeicola vulgatus]MCE9191231.1 hypothetical protein [Phocaeicola vulgatus]
MFTLEELLIETDPDLSRVATIIIGFDDNGNLVLEYDLDDDNPSESYVKNVVIDKQDAYTLAKNENVSLIHYPAYIAKKYSVQPFCQSVPSEAIALFEELLDYLASSGVKYQRIIKRKQ